MTTRRATPLTRRQAMEVLFGVSMLAAAGCAPGGEDRATPAFSLPDQVPGDDVAQRPRHADDVAALCDVLLPTERDQANAIVSPGAAEADVDGVLLIQDFVAVATAQGLVPPLPDAAVARLSGAADAFRAAANAELAVLAARHRPLTAFRDLPRDLQEKVVTEAFADDLQSPVLLVLRAATFLAFLGAVTNDLGLRVVGFPQFESFADGRAVSGYPRTKGGRLVDATREDLASLAGKGDLDDYTYNREPGPTPGDPLATILDAAGDLL